MIDPLTNFTWGSLYSLYDNKCKGFDPNSSYLLKPAFKVNSDRKLYYALIKDSRDEHLSSGTLKFETYVGILYWKLYSQRVSKVYERAHNERSSVEQGLCKLKDILASVNIKNREIDKIAFLITEIGKTRLCGIMSETSLPVRSTLLHFIYPDLIPIFDKMVLKAVGITEKNANQKMQYFKEYIPFNWGLCATYKDKMDYFKDETPVRVIDMALWAVR